MRELKPGDRRRLHMHDEGAESRRRILAEFRRSEPVAAAHLWIARIGGRPERAVRDECFRSLVAGVLELGTTRIVVESCAQDARDRAVIGDVLASRGAITTARCDVTRHSGNETVTMRARTSRRRPW